MELESEEPTEMGDDVISSEDEGGREVVATSVERRKPAAAFTGGGWEAERRGDVLMPWKRTASSDAVSKREAKRTWSPRPSEASPALSPPAPGMVGQPRWSEERARTPASLGPAPVHDLQQGDAPPAALGDAPRAGGRDDSRADREPAGSTPPLVEVRGHGSRPVSSPRPMSPLPVG